jgi:hypothetical protein
MTIPSIKGMAFGSVVEDVVRLCKNGRIQPEALQLILTPDDLPYMREEVISNKWYPITCYQRMLELLRKYDGGDRDDYVRERGMRAAQRLIDAGIYQQLRYASEVQEAIDRNEALERLKLIVTLWNGMFNVGAWRVYVDEKNPDELGVIINGAEDVPAIALEAIEGFITRITEFDAIPTSALAFERIAPDVVRLKMVLRKTGRRGQMQK